MQNPKRILEFESQVDKKFNLYKSLFLSLPFDKIKDTGHFIPLLQEHAIRGLSKDKEPLRVFEEFIEKLTEYESEVDQIDFMFRVIQYIERLVVLFDSIEDAGFEKLNRYSGMVKLKEVAKISESLNLSEEICSHLNEFSLRIVFTAHPTQFYPARVLDIIDNLRNYVTENRISKIDETLRQLGVTSLINTHKPTPLDEAKNIIYFLRNVHYNAVARVYKDIKSNFKKFNNYDIIRLGFWPGGDRDGNPFVDYKTTQKVADELRSAILKCYYNEIKELEKKLTVRGVYEVLLELKADLYSAIFDGKYISHLDILKPLLDIKNKLKNNYDNLFIEEVNDFIDKVNIFKTHFASLDIRQNHFYHESIINKILIDNEIIKNDINELNEIELTSILINKELKINNEIFENNVEIDTILNINSIIDIQKQNGEDAIHRYIISNSEDIFSVLYVYALLKNLHFYNKPISFDIVPLFESMDALKNAKTIMKKLFDIPEYRDHIRNRNNKQTMMLGFSDGTKDGGYIKANWSIFVAKEELTEICREYEIEPIFFDGRGGPPARGGGKSYRFYASQPDSIANKNIQLTIQGQTITSKYGTEEQFVHNGKQLINASLQNILSFNKNKISNKNRELIEKLSEISFNKYLDLKNHPVFIDYLENKSTLKYYSRANIGSRPAKRGQTKKLTLSDLRAIAYVSSWSQLKQNVPGYYGIGTAIKEIVESEGLDTVKSLFNEVQFIKSLLLNSMMVLSKSNFSLTKYLKKDQKYGEFWELLYNEYELTKTMLLEISGYDELMQEEIISKKSIEIREELVMPLLIIQQAALQKLEKGTDKKEIYEKIVERSLYGNINASRNSV